MGENDNGFNTQWKIDWFTQFEIIYTYNGTTTFFLNSIDLRNEK